MESHSHRILFVDTWSYGLELASILAASLHSDDVAYVHCDSLTLFGLPRGQESSRTSSVGAGNAASFPGPIWDLKSKNYSLVNVYEDWAPDAIVTLSLHNLIHRWVSMTAATVGIPHIVVLHGVRPSKSIDVDTLSSFLTRFKSPIRTICRAAVYGLEYRYYLQDCLRVGAQLRLSNVIRELMELFLRHEKYREDTNITYNIRPRVVFTMSERDATNCIEKFGVDGERVIVTGPLDVDRIKLSETLASKCEMSPNEIGAACSGCLFVGQPLVEEGYLSRAEFHAVLRASRIASESAGLDFVYRPHPRETTAIPSSIRVSEGTLGEDLLSAGVVLGWFSTVLRTAEYLGIPVCAIQVKGSSWAEFLDLSRRSEILNVWDFDTLVIEDRVRQVLTKIKGHTPSKRNKIRMLTTERTPAGRIAEYTQELIGSDATE